MIKFSWQHGTRIIKISLIQILKIIRLLIISLMKLINFEISIYFLQIVISLYL